MHITVDTIIGDTIAEACAVHGMDAEQFAAAFNARFATK